MRHGALAHEHDRVEVEGDDLVPGALIDRDGRAASAGDGGVVDQDVEAAEPVDHLAYGPFALRAEGDVGDDGGTGAGDPFDPVDDLDRAGCSLGRDVDHPDLGALTGEQRGDRDSGPEQLPLSPGAGDDGDAAGEPVARVGATARDPSLRACDCSI